MSVSIRLVPDHHHMRIVHFASLAFFDGKVARAPNWLMATYGLGWDLVKTSSASRSLLNYSTGLFAYMYID